MTRTAGGWRMLAKDFPPWRTVSWWFRRIVRLMLFRTIDDIALMMDRERVGRAASPSAPVIDSQTVKVPAPGAGARCHAQPRRRQEDGRPQAPCRRRYRRPPAHGQSHPAKISDSAGAQTILDALRKRWRWIKHLFADGAYDRTQRLDKAAFRDFVVEVVRRIDSEPG